MYVQVMGQWTVGNEYLRRWLRQEWESLRQVQATALDESSFEQLLQLGHTKETEAFQSEVQSLESDFARLMEMQHRGERRGGDLEQEIDRLQRYLTAARRDLHRTQSAVQSDVPLFRTPTRRGV